MQACLLPPEQSECGAPVKGKRLEGAARAQTAAFGRAADPVGMEGQKLMLIPSTDCLWPLTQN